jgi:hypothetical protein
MFWTKKNKVEVNHIRVCEVNQGLPECNSVNKLREYQQQLKNIKNSSLTDISAKYLNVVNDSYLRSELYCIEVILNQLIRRTDNTYINFEERFKAFGKEIDDYIKKDCIIDDLIKKIKVEKNILGIE